jgi:hypothetical protein
MSRKERAEYIRDDVGFWSDEADFYASVAARAEGLVASAKTDEDRAFWRQVFAGILVWEGEARANSVREVIA